MTLHHALVDGVLTLTLADVENRNALGPELVGALSDALDGAEADPNVRVIVLTNEGSTFCAGANLRQQSSDTPPPVGGGLDRLLLRIRGSRLPVIARIAGHAVGGGVGLAAVCDVSIAADDVLFGFTEVRLGVVPAIISVVCLPKMRHGEAMEAFLRGNRFPAARAAELGIINRTVPAAELDAAAAEVVADIVRGGPVAIGHAKALLYRVPGADPEAMLAEMAALSAGLFASAEAGEGMAAFLERRDPAWISRS